MIKKKRLFFSIFAILTLLMTAFIFSNSLLVAEASAERSGRFIPLLQKILSSVGIDADSDTLSFIIRKTAHFLEYFLLCALASGVVLSQTERESFLIFSPVYCFLVAVCDEFIMQGMTEGRSAEWRDVGIDVSGALLCLCVVLITIKLIKRNRR